MRMFRLGRDPGARLDRETQKQVAQALIERASLTSGSEAPGVDREYVTRLITSTFPGDRNRSIRKFLNAEIDALLADESMKR